MTLMTSQQAQMSQLTCPSWPSRDGFSFTSWNSSEDGSGTSYGSGDAFVMPGDGETDHLHAQWTQNPVTTTTEVPVTTTTEVPVTTTTEVPALKRCLLPEVRALQSLS